MNTWNPDGVIPKRMSLFDPYDNLPITSRCPPFPVINSSKWRFKLEIPEPKRIKNPSGDWHPGKGNNLIYHGIILAKL